MVAPLDCSCRGRNPFAWLPGITIIWASISNTNYISGRDRLSIWLYALSHIMQVMLFVSTFVLLKDSCHVGWLFGVWQPLCIHDHHSHQILYRSELWLWRPVCFTLPLASLKFRLLDASLAARLYQTHNVRIHLIVRICLFCSSNLFISGHYLFLTGELYKSILAIHLWMVRWLKLE